MKTKKSLGSHIFDTINVILMVIVGITTIYPFWNIIVTSFSAPAEANTYGLHLYTLKPTLYAYKKIFANEYLLTGFRNSIFRTVVGTALNLVMSCMVAYPLSKKDLPLRNFWTTLIVFTMFFSGGLIPSYLLVTQLGLRDTIWALILPTLINTYNMIIIRNGFQSLPPDLEESAKLDGANDIIILFRIVLPVSIPTVATVGLWYAVGHWNAWFDALIYTTKESLLVLQLILYRMIVQGSMQFMQLDTGAVTGDAGFNPTPGVIKAAAIVVTTLPIVCVYPFIQRFFMKGIMVGSLKG